MKTPTYSTWNAEFPAYKCTRNKGPDSVGDHGKQIQRRQPVHRSPESRRTDVLLKTLRIRRGLHHCLRSRSPRTSLMKGSKGVSLWGLARAKVKVPLVFFYCTLFFLAGFYGSLHFSPGFSGDRVPRGRLLEVEKEASDLPGLPNGETGESRPSSVTFQVLSWKPRAVYFPKFVTEEDCQNIIKIARPSLEPSTLALREGETEENTRGVRTSSGTFISASEDSTGILDQIEQKISRVTMIPIENMEPFNILRYEIGQRYASHYDVFNPAEYGPQQSNRVATFLIYLTDVEEGGETIFPFENGLNMGIGYDYQKCIGLKVKPHQGDGLLFYSMFTNHTIDPLSLHGSCPVIKGEKWAATKWIRDEIQDYI